MKTGLVLEGGGIRGIFSAGVLDVLMEEGIEFDGGIGVSAGAAFGCNYKSRQPRRAIRYNLKYAKDPRYSSMRSLLSTGDLFNAQFCYHEIPEKLDPFDWKAFRENPMEFYLVCTDVETGKPVYHLCDNDGDYEMLEWFRASGSMPMVSRVVELGGYKLLDGGISDSIPLRFMEEQGYERNVVILTRPAGYAKHSSKMMGVMSRALKDYPETVKALENRHVMYNQEVAYVRKREAGKYALVIRPDSEIDVGRVEHDRIKIREAYKAGRKAARRRLPEIRRFLAGAKKEAAELPGVRASIIEVSPEERLAAERAEGERISAEKSLAERIAAEKAEAERIAAEKVAAEKAEAERIAAEKAEAERIAAEKAEAERIAAEKAEAERLAAEKAAAEKAEAERIAAEKAAAEKAEAERIAAEKAAAEKAEAERIAAEKAAAEKAEAERIAAEKAAAEKAEAERIAAEKAAAEKAEAERIAAEKAAAEKVEAERLAAEKAAAEKAEAERIAAEKAAAEKAEAERIAAEKAAAEKAEAERIAAEKAAAEKAEAERIAAEKAAAEKAEAERIAAAAARTAAMVQRTNGLGTLNGRIPVRGRKHRRNWKPGDMKALKQREQDSEEN